MGRTVPPESRGGAKGKVNMKHFAISVATVGILVVGSALGRSEKPPEPEPMAPYCVGVKPICVGGSAVCVCDTMGQNCHWACSK